MGCDVVARRVLSYLISYPHPPPRRPRFHSQSKPHGRSVGEFEPTLQSGGPRSGQASCTVRARTRGYAAAKWGTLQRNRITSSGGPRSGQASCTSSGEIAVHCNATVLFSSAPGGCKTEHYLQHKPRMEVDTSPSPTVKPGLTRLPSQDLEPTSSYFARLVSTSSPTLTTHQAAPESQGLIPSIFDPSTSLGPRSSPSTINSSAGSNSLDTMASRRGRPPQAASIGFGPSSPSRGSQPGLVLRILGPTVAWASG